LEKRCIPESFGAYWKMTAGPDIFIGVKPLEWELGPKPEFAFW